MKTSDKRIPFDLELAKKIMNKEAKGRIISRSGHQARIICIDKDRDYPIVALVKMSFGVERPYVYNKKGMEFDNGMSSLDLYLEVPTYYRYYSNFKPCKWQPCLVRDTASDLWEVGVCRGTDSNRVPIFYSRNYSDGFCHWKYFLPLSKITERLICTTKSYEELIQELDNEQCKD